jgi:hypothetical protein
MKANEINPNRINKSKDLNGLRRLETKGTFWLIRATPTFYTSSHQSTIANSSNPRGIHYVSTSVLFFLDRPFSREDLFRYVPIKLFQSKVEKSQGNGNTGRDLSSKPDRLLLPLIRGLKNCGNGDGTINMAIGVNCRKGSSRDG